MILEARIEGKMVVMEIVLPVAIIVVVVIFLVIYYLYNLRKLLVQNPEARRAVAKALDDTIRANFQDTLNLSDVVHDEPPAQACEGENRE